MTLRPLASLFFCNAALTLTLMGVICQRASAQQERLPRAVVADSLFAGIDARPIGPAGTSGRVAAIAVDPRDARILYVGAATGGLWKSLDGGFTWQPRMDGQAVNSIGAVAVSPAAPHVVWVGSGEANARNSMGVGRGVWRSRDGLCPRSRGLGRTCRPGVR
jgi:hypothetical protein